jgi:hypothetical protein
MSIGTSVEGIDFAEWQYKTAKEVKRDVANALCGNAEMKKYTASQRKWIMEHIEADVFVKRETKELERRERQKEGVE